jgi:hypothetical protein
VTGNHPFMKIVRGVALALLVSTLSACGGSLFKVKPAVELPALSVSSRSVNAGGILLRTAPLMTDEEGQALFEANLPLSGVLPVRVELNYETGGVPLDLKRVRFHLQEGGGHAWKLLEPKQAVARILKANDIYLYNPQSRKQFESEFAAYGIDLKTPLTTSENRRQGFLFFQTPDKAPVRRPGTLVLSVSGLPQPLEIHLN